MLMGKICKWVNDEKYFWYSGCGIGESQAERPSCMDWEYCPYCGADIVEEGVLEIPAFLRRDKD